MSRVKKITDIFRNSDRLRKSITHAAGEILLLVLGILIALQIDNWNEDRKTRQEEIIILKEIQSNLELDLARINRNLSNLEDNLGSIKVIKAQLTGDLPYHDSLRTHFAKIIRYGHFPPNTSGYELLKSKGLETISTIKLRRDISLVYERYYAYIKTLEEERYRYNYSTVIAQLQSKFHDNEIFVSSTPNDFEKLKTDNEFMEILNFTESINGYLYNNDYSETRDLVNDLVEGIRQELQRRGH